MSKHYIEFYVGDYMRDTGHLSMIEDGAYFRLLKHVWSTGKLIPKDPAEYYRIARAFTEEERKATDKILGEFFIEKRDGFLNKKAMELFEKRQKKIDQLRENGSKGGRPPKPKQNQKVLKNKTKTKAKGGDNQIQIQNHLNHPPTPQGACARFDEFWKLYPKKVGKADCQRKWTRSKLDAIADKILDAVKRYTVTEKWQDKNGRYIPNPLTFLNGERWNDEIPAPQGATKPRKEFQYKLIQQELTRQRPIYFCHWQGNQRSLKRVHDAAFVDQNPTSDMARIEFTLDGQRMKEYTKDFLTIDQVEKLEVAS